jgi:hypothetical protein
MKTGKFLLICAISFLFISGTAWAGNRTDVAEETPAILASLDKTDFVTLDDTAIAEIRGEALYVMGRIWLLNGLDFSLNPQVDWVTGIANIAEGWRYGNWGGLDYTNEGPPVDLMDSYFQQHDNGAFSDADLIAALSTLPDTGSFWGQIYGPTAYDVDSIPIGPDDAHFDYSVFVSRISVLSTGARRFFFLWRPMPLTEYARRQALFVGNLFGGFPH